MSHNTYWNKKSSKGLHTNLRPLSKMILEHNGEKLEIIFNGKNGKDTFHFTLNGPESFKIGLEHHSNTRVWKKEID